MDNDELKVPEFIKNKTEKKWFRTKPILSNKAYSPYSNPPPLLMDACSCEYGDELVDRSGYIPSKEQIDNFRRAGRNLVEYRKLVYSNEPSPDDMPINPVTQKDFDEFKAHELMNHLDSKAERKKKENAIKNDNDDSQKESKENQETSGQEVDESKSE